MSRELKIIQFIHNGPEHIVSLVPGEIKDYIKSNPEHLKQGALPWHAGRGNLPHRRRFMLTKGKYVDENNNLVEGNLTFWGEWEAPSSYYKINYAGEIPPEYPHYIHYKRFIENTDRNRMNTDPNVFGKEFHYCCCKQNAPAFTRLLQSLETGSIILFGSARGTNENYRFILDTVFVVKKYVKYNTLQAELLKEQDIVPISNSYYLTSIKPLNDGDSVLGVTHNYTLYSGVPFSNESRCFSFFPCKKADISNLSLDSTEITQYTFKRPSLNLDKYGLGRLAMGVKGNVIDGIRGRDEFVGMTDEQIVKKYWDMLVEDLRCQGLDIGVFAEEPTEEYSEEI